MTTEIQRLRWRARRGMRELDAVLRPFVERSLESLSDADKERFGRLLELSDPELYDYLLRRHEPDDPDLARLLERIRARVDD